MPTKEEMLSGIIRVNNEVIDSKVVAHSSKSKVHGNDSGGNDQYTGDTNTRKAPVKAVESRPKESLREFAERRTGEISSALEEATDTQARLEAEITGVLICIEILIEERQLLEKLYDKESSLNSILGHQPVAAPGPVLSDKERDGTGRSGGVGGKHNRRKRKAGNEKGPDA